MTELLCTFSAGITELHDEEDAKPAADRAPPPVLNTCHALASDSPVVKKRWPRVYSGPDRELDEHHQPLLDGIT